MFDRVANPRRNPRLARIIDVLLAGIALVLLAPLWLSIALAVWFGGRPVLFAQERLGQHGVPFRMHKFRTLVTVAGATVTPTGDPRVSPLGRMLRRVHLDELPQLVDVLRGRMALIGPRPEVPANLAAVEAGDLARLLAVRPGITGPTQLAFIAEDDVLARCPDPVRAYREILVPAKVRHDLAWLPRRTLCGDLAVLLATPLTLASRRRRAASQRRVSALLGQ